MLTAQPTENARNPLPVWVSIPIILLCFVGGGWIIHWYVVSDPLAHESKILGDAPTQTQWNGWPGGQTRGRNFPGNGGGNPFNSNGQRQLIQNRGDGRWDLRTSVAHLDVSFANGKLNWHTIEYTGNYSFVPAEVKSTILSARTLSQNEASVAALKLTPEQVKRLKGLSQRITMTVSEADRSQLGTAMEAYINAAPAERSALETKVVQLLDQIAAKSMADTKKLAEDRAAQINTMITPEMWKQDAAMGGAGNPAAKAAPTAIPPSPAK